MRKTHSKQYRAGQTDKVSYTVTEAVTKNDSAFSFS